MPTLADIYSTADSFKRRLYDTLANPGTSLQQMLGQANDQSRNYLNLMDQATAESGNNPLNFKTPANQKLAQMYAEGLQPSGIFKAVEPNIAFKALKMEKAGSAPTEIWNKLGVYRNPADNQWRQEISDKSSFLKGTGDFESTLMNRMKALGKDKTAEPVTVGDVFHHPELFDAYPELKDVELRFTPKNVTAHGRNVSPEGEKGWIEINPSLNSKDAKSTLLHELQHQIQENENWAVGGTAADFNQQDAATKARDILAWRKEVESTADRMGWNPSNNADWYRNAEDKLVQDYYNQGIADWMPHEDARWQASFPSYSKGTDSRTQAQQLVNMYGLDVKPTAYTADQMYRRLGGEVEARQVQARQNLTPQQRAQYFPGIENSDISSGPVYPYGIDRPVDQLLYMNNKGIINPQSQ
jgi:hypothetical protein